MRINNPQTRDLLAAEYVLGVLQPATRARFEKMLVRDSQLKALVDQWQSQLEMIGVLPVPLTPPAYIYADIQRALGFKPKPKPKSRVARAWRWTAVFASVTAIALAALLVFKSINERIVQPGVDVFVSLAGKEKQVAWIIQSRIRHGRLIVNTVKPKPIDSNQSYELWLITKTDKKPISLGLIQAQGQSYVPLNPELRAKFKNAKLLAVSLEPKGGSPTGSPTTVVYTGAVNRF